MENSTPFSIPEKAQRWRTLVQQHGSSWSWEEAQQQHRTIFADEAVPVAWWPDESTVAQANITQVQQALGLTSYADFYRWSVENKAAFWETAVNRLGIAFRQPYQQVLDRAAGAEDPRWLPGARLNIGESCFQAPSDKTALVVRDEAGNEQRWTYVELDSLTQRVASGLTALGLTPGDRVGLYMPLSAEAVAAYLGIIRAGMVAVLIADSFSAGELERRLALADAKLLITVAVYSYNNKPLVVYDRVKQAQSPRAVVVAAADVPRRPDDLHWDDFLGPPAATYHEARPDDLISILFSSGTTREPKAIPWTHLTPIKGATDAHFHQDVHPDDVLTWTTGMGWMMGPWAIFAALMNRATLALFVGSAASPTFGRFMQDVGVTVLGTIPSLVRVWRSTQAMEAYDWPVRMLSSTGEPSSADDYFYLMWLTGFRAPIVEYCGGTEIGGGYLTGAVVQPAAPATFTTPTLGTELRFRHEASGQLSPIPSGEVFIVPPAIGLSQRLLNRDHHQEYYVGVPTLPDGTPLRKHGDIYRMLGRVGDTWFCRSGGRTDDSMNLGGIKVSAVEIEKVLNRHPAVQETAAVAVAPPDGGPEQLVVHYVAAAEMPMDVLKKELQQAISTELNPLFRIQRLVAQPSLPRTASNKLLRRSLRS